ncbi:nucleotidyltransferase domain-containing protein [Acidithiobacillus acidisediminis]|uniref:nucleotidyltransferase domain-containing protein n=1 Tax=Acidithiobacillus acidisediminis TaxID=2937799 RepID=UPI00200E8BDB|nr:nucleotidyltransferase domain-containing protein [Acidithiobacillus sp. S30A2]
MRLSAEQVSIIRQTVAEIFGPEVQVSLFGSRVDDSKKGGDVDLLIESAQAIGEPAWLAAQLAARLERSMEGRKVDVLFLAPNLRRLPIHDIAQKNGIPL